MTCWLAPYARGIFDVAEYTPPFPPAPRASPMSSASDRNLLFGVLALQLDFVSRDALIRAMNAWALDKHRPLGLVLGDQGQLSADRLRLLDALVAEHLNAHGGDTQQSLQALSSGSSVEPWLAEVADANVRESLAQVRAPGNHVVPAAPR